MPTNYQQMTPYMDDFGEQKSIQMDPKLQKEIILRRSGVKRNASSSTSEDELAVLAKVSDVEAWKELTEVRLPVVITPAADGDNWIVTGRVPIKRITFIRSLAFVKSLKAARRLTPSLIDTVKDLDIANYIATHPHIKGGTGVLIGIVDSGCDFAHKNFITAGKKSRILKFWDQTNEVSISGSMHGKVYTAAEMNKALTRQDPYTALGYRPGKKMHGTHVMDIAAGNGRGTGITGVAPTADILFVQLSSSDVPWEGPEALSKNFGDSVNLIEAIKFIFDEAGSQPCVINISLGTNGGPHDGSTLVEQAIDSMLKEKPNRCVVIAASNSFDEGIHSTGSIEPGATYQLPWLVSETDNTENEMEIWYNGKDRISAEIFDPAGKSLGTIEPGETGTIKDADNNIRLVASNRLDDPNNHDNVIGIWLKANSGGTWMINLKNITAEPSEFHAWIERDDYGQSNFGSARDDRYTLGSISCSHNAITVGCYDAHGTTFPISYFSSSGPTRDGRLKPEISAPGNAVVAASSESFTGVTSKSGTSMAAPAVAGCIALLYEEAMNQNKNISIAELKTFIEKSGRLQPPNESWDPRYGNGRIRLKELIQQMG